MADGEELTAKQRKNKKKKEAAKRKKQGQNQKDVAEITETTNGFIEDRVEKIQVDADKTPKEKFQRELDWCIEQLELGLAFQKPDKKQAENTHRFLKSLKSPKTPMPRKRQIMFSLFGDYRKKIEEDRKKVGKEPLASLKLSTVKQEKQKSIFVKLSQKKSRNSATNEGDGEGQQDGDLESGWKFETSDNSFRFLVDDSES